VIREAARAAMLAAVGCVGHVLIFEEDTPIELPRRVRPDVLVKGGTCTAELVGMDLVEGYSCKACATVKNDGVPSTENLSALADRPSHDPAHRENG
jgi:bifunctional ADP-heptose synthase (sugar kinase/adenylyltransferase)